MGVKITELTTTTYNDADFIPVANPRDGTRKLQTIALAAAASVPTDIRQAILTLFQQAAYSDDTDRTEEIDLLTEWASTTVTAITLSQTSISFTEEGSVTLTATLYPSDATGTVSWSSSDSSVASVSNGVVVTVGNGSCTITASIGSIYASCAVTVTGMRELESISAVYTQSGDVSTFDSLSDLTADLVVTATYSDSSTAVISSDDYTLSGTLTEGTSTITVSYGGFTATFDVTVIGDVLYQLANTFTSNGASYIDTEVAYETGKTYTICADFTITSTETDVRFIFGNGLTSSCYNKLQTQNTYIWGMGIPWSSGNGLGGIYHYRAVILQYPDEETSHIYLRNVSTSTDYEYSNSYSSGTFLDNGNVQLGYPAFSDTSTKYGFVGTIDDFVLLERTFASDEITAYLDGD